MVRDIRILVIADDPLARNGLAALIAAHPGLDVIARAAGDARLASELDIYRADAAVWDLGWEPSGPAADHNAHLLSEMIDTGLPIVLLVSNADEASRVWAAGARVLLLREHSIEQLAAAVIAAQEGLTVLDSALTDALAHPTSSPASAAEPLTPREREVLQYLVEGYSNKAIAHQLSISEHTVKFHVNSLMSKLNAQSRTEVVVRATRLGLITL